MGKATRATELNPKTHDSSTGIAALVTHLETEGPNTRKIARLLGENEATLRYWFRERLAKKGFVLQASVNYGAIGLQRMMVVALVSREYMPIVDRVFKEMSESAYLVYFCSNALDGSYVFYASVPTELLYAYYAFVLELKAVGFFAEIREITRFEWFRVLPMKVESYNFDTYSWDMDLSRPTPKAEVKVAPAGREKFDKTDLMVMATKQVDARFSVKEIARKLGIDYKKALRHYGHATDRKLISSYRILWPRTRYDPATRSIRSTRHTFLLVDVGVRDLTGSELEKLMMAVHRLPFVWAEMGGRNYECDIAIPLDLAGEALLYLRKVARDYYGRARISIIAPDESYAYSIAPALYDQKAKRWTFDSVAAVGKIRSLLLTVKR